MPYTFYIASESAIYGIIYPLSVFFEVFYIDRVPEGMPELGRPGNLNAGPSPATQRPCFDTTAGRRS